MAVREDAPASPDGDLLELLFPDGGEQRETGRRWAQLLRLVVDDSRSPRGTSTAGELSAAKRLLVAADLTRAIEALEDLLRHVFDALLDADSWFALARPRSEWNAAWRRFDDALSDSTEAPPAPGEALVTLAERWVACFEQLAARCSGVQAARLERRALAWHFALLRARDGAVALGAVVERTPRRGIPARVAVLEARIALALERGDPREAAALIEPERALVALDPDLGQSARLVARLLDSAAEDAIGWNGLVPEAGAPFVDGAAANPRPPAPEPHALPERRSVGASFVAAFEVSRDGALHVRALDVAPGLAERVAGFVQDRSRSWRSAGSAERIALEAGAPQVRRGTRLADVLDRAGARACACVPFPGDATAGWLHLEFEHALVPGPLRLAKFADAWARTTGDAADELEPGDAVRGEAPRSPRGARSRWASEWLGTRTGWCWDVALDGRLELVFGPAEGAPPLERITRVLRLGLALRSDLVVVPLLHAARTIGLVASAAFDEGSVEPEHVAAWQDARFADWHRSTFGRAVEPRVARGGIELATLIRAARARAALEITGAGGVGKELLARRVHFERGDGGPLLHVPDESAWDALASEPRGTLLCEEPGRWSRRAQLALATAAHGPRYVALTREPLARGVATGQVEPALAARFARLGLRAVPLVERRVELAALAELLLERVAEEESWERPTLDDEAHAFLWRQAWEGGVRALENVLYRACLALRSDALRATDLQAALLELGGRPVARLATDDQLVLGAALDVTRLANGRENKRRAALYLGWDRDTVAARCRERDAARPPGPSQANS